ncbi:IclR family transcriptional regulator [Egibacter rhizosphaerae]|uniref:Glycerol operon regulatory protein n=1 Tax=Egibacter rhizosphaerae TaxID=1670831 RepID=A0A411YHE1_9ACTN|nr:IclR family transcriptional regulator [Egibacter rhizosphaerae]QBI20526.1 IclR family transcriptional regulator [Egibacter rhizosphaerae]
MPGRIQSIERAVAVLRVLAASPTRLGLGEVAGALDLPKPTAHGLLRTLCDVGFVEQESTSGKYELGRGLFELDSAPLDVNELRSRAINWCDSLAARSKASVRIGTHERGQVLVVHHVFRPDDSVQVLEVGSRLPLHACALGKVLLAYDPGARAKLSDDDLEARTWRTIISPTRVARTLELVRERGWAGEVEELATGHAGIAAPIRGNGGLVVGAVGISGPLSLLCNGAQRPDPALAVQVHDAARAISQELASAR